jgi:hypothetical protein
VAATSWFTVRGRLALCSSGSSCSDCPGPPTVSDKLTRVASLLADESSFDAMTENGSVLELWPAGCAGAVLRATARSGSAELGDRLGLHVVLGGVSHAAVLVVEQISTPTPGRMLLEARVIHAMPRSSSRRQQRFHLSLHATITPAAGPVAGHPTPARIEDLSLSGFAASIPHGHLDVGDPIRLVCRVLEGEIRADARVVRAAPARLSGTRIGCRFVDAPGDARWVLRRLLHRLEAADARPEPARHSV